MASQAIEPADIETAKEWFSAAELAELCLPGLPTNKRSINRRADDEGWAARVDSDQNLLCRPRKARGGGIEFHISLLPPPAQLELARRGIATVPDSNAAADPGASGWAWFERQDAKTKAKAERCLSIVQEIEIMTGAGTTRTAAIAHASADHGVCPATLWSWLRAIEGVDPANRLPALAPRSRGGGKKSEIDDELWQLFLSDYLRLSAPPLSAAYRRTAAIAKESGLSIPTEKTFRRRLNSEIDPRIIKLKRDGEEALRRSVPAQRRTIDHLRVMEHVNIDGHTFNVFVEPPPGSRKTKPVRPTMVAIQDLRSSKIMAWRIAETECSLVTRLAFADLFRNWGIPRECTLDNGRAFASKWITGGAKSRYRFKIRDEEPAGLLTILGIKIHWAQPYRGQSKPIERAFRDLDSTISRSPAMEGAYTGKDALSKPANYGSRVIPWAEFVEQVNQGIALHNSQTGRRGRDYAGRSFDEVYAQHLSASPVGKATPEQLRLALLAADQKMVNKQTGAIELYGNRYWSHGTSLLHGQRVTVRFDPENLRNQIHVYSQDGKYLCSAEQIIDSGFDDVEGARATAKRVKELRENVRKGADAQQLLNAEQVAARQASIRPVATPEASVIRPVRQVGNTAAALKPASKQSTPKPNSLDRVSALSLRLVDKE